MVEQSRKRHPGVEFRVCDVRDLSQFGDGSFEFVFFSFNGIDYIGPDDRIGALCEIYRVLSNGGAFAFSSHNRNAPRRAAWSPAHLPLNINPLRKPQSFAFQLVRYPLGIFNRLVNRRHERQTGAYELRNDEALEYSLITYYIHVADQVRQLEEARFQDCRAIDLSGRWLEAGDFPNARDHWIYYLCRRG